MADLHALADAISDKSPNIKRFAQAVADELQPALPPPPPASPLPHYRLTLTPNYNNGADSSDVANNYNAVWVYSNNEKGYKPPNGRDPYRVLLLDPRATDAAGKPGRDEWWFVVSRCWPSSYDPNQHGQWGSQANFHNVASSDGPSGGVGWGFGSGVSAVTVGWLPGQTAPCLMLEYVKSGGVQIPLPATRDTMHEYALHFVAGRTDGTTARPGSVAVFADGVLVTSMDNANTVQRATAPDGTAHTQRWICAAWDGDYTRNLPAPSTTEFLPTRVGATLEEARADVPQHVGGTIDAQKWNGKQPDDGPPTLVTV